MRNWINWFVASLCCVILFVPGTGAQERLTREYQVKAVFLFNFTQFVEWPPEAFATADTPFVIGVLGKDPFGPYLDAAVNKEYVQGHPLIVERYATLADIRRCHVLYVSLSSKQGFRQILDAVKSKPVLTVSDAEGFAKAGGMIQFYNDKSRIRLRINVGPVSDSKLIISSKLLRLAEIIPAGAN